MLLHVIDKTSVRCECMDRSTLPSSSGICAACAKSKHSAGGAQPRRQRLWSQRMGRLQITANRRRPTAVRPLIVGGAHINRGWVSRPGRNQPPPRATSPRSVPSRSTPPVQGHLSGPAEPRPLASLARWLCSAALFQSVWWARAPTTPAPTRGVGPAA